MPPPDPDHTMSLIKDGTATTANLPHADKWKLRRYWMDATSDKELGHALSKSERVWCHVAGLSQMGKVDVGDAFCRSDVDQLVEDAAFHPDELAQLGNREKFLRKCAQQHPRHREQIVYHF